MAQNPRLEAAIKDGDKALAKPKCRDLIAGPSIYGGNNPRKLLRTLNETGHIVLGKDSHAYLGYGNQGTLTLAGFLFGPNYTGQATSMGFENNPPIPFTLAVEVLHELSHLTGKFSHPGYNPGKLNPYPHELNKLILKTCFGK